MSDDPTVPSPAVRPDQAAQEEAAKVVADQPTVLVVDFGAQYAQLIARRVREAHVYSEIVPHSITAAELAERAPAAIIFSGGPKSVRVPDAPVIDPGVYDLGVPILGICYGQQLIAQQLGGEVGGGGAGEYGRSIVHRIDGVESTILTEDLPHDQTVWMSHFDAVQRPPEGFVATASSEGAPCAVIESPERKIWGVQYHPEVAHTPHGQELITRFLHDLVGLPATWTMENFIDASVEAIRAQVGSGRAICGLSGGVDSAVAAALVHKAIGPQLTCVFVDTGLMRKNEGEQVVETFQRHQGIELIHVRAADRFFERLAGVTEPEAKRKVIGELFIRVFEDARGGVDDAQFLVQGTLYPDVISRGPPCAATIKPPQRGRPSETSTSNWSSPCACCSGRSPSRRPRVGSARRDRVASAVPRPGLGVRIIGEVTPPMVALLRKPMRSSGRRCASPGSRREIWQAFAVLPDIRSVGVMGDERTYGHPIIIRAVTSEDAMTADWARIPYDVLESMASRIINEVPGINRVAYDITSKPPGTIEWE